MKRIILAVLCIVCVVIAFVCIGGADSNDNGEFLRIHIRADSNSDADQNVKYAVKRAVVDYLTPYLAEAESKEKAVSIIRDNVDGICAVANEVLKSNGFSYECSAAIRNEYFPTRSYGNLTLESGVYDALILNLGSGEGDNWWCVVYPPLCFVGGEGNGASGIYYRSKIYEIIQNWRNSRK